MILTPESSVILDNTGTLSRDSVCSSFDNRANGIGRAEGVSVVIIKSLKDAIRHGDMIRAVIRSIASNQDGQTEERDQPNRRTQIDLIKDTYSKAGIGFDDTRYFEANGRGLMNARYCGHC